MNDLIRAKLEEIVEFQDIIQKVNLNYKSKLEKTYNIDKYLYLLFFKRYTRKIFIMRRC